MVNFIQHAESILSMKNVRVPIQKQGPLRAFLKDFFPNWFMPRVRADALLKVEEIFDSENRFRIQEVYSPGFSNDATPLLQCSVNLGSLLQSLFKVFFVIHKIVDAEDFVQTVKSMLQFFFEKCQERYNEVTRGLFSSHRLSSPGCLEILRNDPLYRQFLGRSRRISELQSELGPSTYHSDEFRLFHRLFNNIETLQPKLLCFEPSTYITLANLSESLRWIGQRVVELANPMSSAYASSSARSRGQPVAANFFSEESEFTSRPLTETIREAAPIAELINGNFINLSERCLFTLRLEFQAHCLYFLGEIHSGDYFLENESVGPEPFIINLNKDLILAEDMLTPYLNKDKQKYVFSNIPRFLSTVLIKSLGKIKKKRFNTNGVHKMSRNLFALQQNLTNLVVASKESHFDRVRKYYELLLVSKAELEEFQRNDHDDPVFSKEEYDALWEARSAIAGSSNVSFVRLKRQTSHLKPI
eukprot:1004537_1